MEEIWKDIPDYEGIYQASNLGRIKSFQKNRGIRNIDNTLKLVKTKMGYLQVSLCKNKKVKSNMVHRLILLTFKFDDYFEDAQVNHIDGNKLNNTIDNLEWCTSKENIIHAFNTGLRNTYGENHPRSKLNEKQVRIIRLAYKNKYFTQKELAKIFNIYKLTISQIVNNKTWTHI